MSNISLTISFHLVLDNEGLEMMKCSFKKRLILFIFGHSFLTLFCFLIVKHFHRIAKKHFPCTSSKFWSRLVCVFNSTYGGASIMKLCQFTIKGVLNMNKSKNPEINGEWGGHLLRLLVIRNPNVMNFSKASCFI